MTDKYEKTDVANESTKGNNVEETVTTAGVNVTHSNIEPEVDVKESALKEPICKKTEYSPWQTIGESVVGMAHRRGDVPVVCQDAYCIANGDRTVLAVCDGAGSSAMSEIGSQQLSQGIVRLFYSIDNVISPLLDTKEHTDIGNKLAEIIYCYSIKLLQDVATNKKRPVKDFRTTLLLVIVGKENLFWFKVGDGEIVVEENKQLFCLGKSLKGEYSNETVFIDETLKVKDVQYGIMDVTNTTGIAVMSDGTSERLVSINREKIAPRLSEFFESLRNSKLPREKLYMFLNDYEVWKGSTHDDKTLVVASRKKLQK